MSLHPIKIFKFLGQDTTKTRQLSADEYLDATASKSISFIEWVQSFTKRIIVVVFAIFILIDLITLATAIFACIENQDSSSVNILISETNNTFRDIIGGYLVKSACENVSMGVEKIVTHFIDKKMEQAVEEVKEDTSSADIPDEILNP